VFDGCRLLLGHGGTVARLVAIGRSPEEARSSVRFSLGRFTTDDDIDYTLEVLPAVVERFRSVTPHAPRSAAR